MLKIHPDACRRLLFALSELGFVERDRDEYFNSSLGAHCTSSRDATLSAFKAWGAPFYHMWEHLPDAIREYSPRWQQALGTTAEEVFGALYEDPVRLRSFTAFLHAWSAAQGQSVAECFDFGMHRCVLDAGGGTGALAIAAGLRNPRLRGLVMDLPVVCPIATEYITRAGLTDRFHAAPGDLFDGASYPKEADVIILGSVLHDWSDAGCREILRNCHAVLPRGGTLLVCEKVVRAGSSWAAFASMMDLWMLVTCAPGAKERTEPEFRDLLEDAGFSEVEIVTMNAPRDLIVSRRT
jgi:acetylserotonin N-methyltransferase